MITPSLGRIVLFHPFPEVDRLPYYQPHVAIVTFVHSDRAVNLAVFNSSGGNYSRENIPFLQDAENPQKGTREWAEWAPDGTAEGKARAEIRAGAKVDAAAETAADKKASETSQAPRGGQGREGTGGQGNWPDGTNPPDKAADDRGYSGDRAPDDSAWAQHRADRLGGQGRVGLASDLGPDEAARRAELSGGAARVSDDYRGSRLKAEAEDTAQRPGETVEQRDARVAAVKTAAGL